MAKRKQTGEKRGPGRPPVHGEDYTRTTVVLLNRQIAQLDRFAADVRATTGAVINRGEIIRALIEAFHVAKIDPGTITSEADLVSSLAARTHSR